jgi:hypothetical protein
MFVLLKFPVIVKVHIDFGLSFAMSLSDFYHFLYLCCCIIHGPCLLFSAPSEWYARNHGLLKEK